MILKLNPGLRAGSYDLGRFYLVQGDYLRADSIYSEAVGRYGADSGAVENLQALIRNGVEADGARRLLEIHFGVRAPPDP